MIAKQKIREKEKTYLKDILNDNFYLSLENYSFNIDNINFNIDYNVTTYSLGDQSLDISKTYLLSFSVLRKRYEQNIMIKLIDPEWSLKDDLKNEQYINYVALKIPILSEENSNIQKDTFSFAFKPNSENFNKIIFQSLGDYEVEYSYGEEQVSENRIVDVENIQLQEINTAFIEQDDLEKMKEFGIQAPPGLLFTINGEGFHIGRTGTFYLAEDDFIFESIGICSNTIPFIIDYKIEE